MSKSTQWADVRSMADSGSLLLVHDERRICLVCSERCCTTFDHVCTAAATSGRRLEACRQQLDCCHRKSIIVTTRIIRCQLTQWKSRTSMSFAESGLARGRRAAVVVGNVLALRLFCLRSCVYPLFSLFHHHSAIHSTHLYLFASFANSFNLRMKSFSNPLDPSDLQSLL